MEVIASYIASENVVRERVWLERHDSCVKWTCAYGPSAYVRAGVDETTARAQDVIFKGFLPVLCETYSSI